MYKGEFVSQYSGEVTLEDIFGSTWIYEQGKDGEMKSFLADPYSTTSELPDEIDHIELSMGREYVVYIMADSSQ